jgi:hypothetical protein
MNKEQNTSYLKLVVGKIQKNIEKCTFECLCQNCFSSAISSHSQQKEGQLRVIAKEGLVYALNKNIYQSIKNLVRGESISLLTKTGIKEASAFRGYCSFHDELIFRPIEQKQLVPFDSEQAALLFLRAISYEYAAKRKAAIQYEMMVDIIGDNIYAQRLEPMKLLVEGIKLYLTREGPFLLQQIFNVITKKEYGSFHTSWVRHPQKLPISVATSVCPWLNNYYQKWSHDKPQAMVSFTVIPNDNYTDVVCSWLDYCHEDSTWIQEEMKTPKGLEKVVNLLGISESEDLCINIDFWESLEEETKELVISNLQHSMDKGPTIDVPLIIRLNN